MPDKPDMQIDESKTYRVTVESSKGSFAMDLMPSLAPKTVNNFVHLARQGYYDGLTFHRYVPEFVIQGGDPTGTGSGGPGYKFEDEPVKGSYREGAVAMANSGPNTNGSQFFICITDCQHKLTPSYNLFGYVVTGQDVVNSLRQGDRMDKLTVEERAS
jgi:cyclophilin family peptidyl-prolyl cis-trans isomerase